MIVFPSSTKFQPSPKLAITISDSSVVSVLTLIPPQRAPLPPPSFTPNSITVILSTTTYRSLSSPASNRFGTLSLVKAPKSCQITPILRCLYWLKITEHIEYKLFSLTYKVLTIIQPPYIYHLISVQPPHSTRCSSLVTLARPPTSSSLRITDRSFSYASQCLWNQLPSSLRQPYSSPSVSDFPVHDPATSSYSFNSPLSPSITPSLFHSRLKTYLFHKSFPPQTPFRPQD